MNVVAPNPVPAAGPVAILVHMAEQTGKLERQFVKLTPEHRRRLIHLSVDADAKSVETFAGDLLAKVIDRLWADFDPKRGEAAADRPGKKR